MNPIIVVRHAQPEDRHIPIAAHWVDAVLSDLGRLHFLNGNMEDALKILQGAASLPESNLEGIYYLGRTYMELGDFNAAADTFEKLIAKEKDFTPSYLALGQTYGKLARIPEAHYFLGIYHYRKGDDRTAHYHLMRAAKDLKDPERIEDARRMLKSIGKLPPKAEE